MRDDFLRRFDALPTGYSEGRFQGRRYGVTKTVKSKGRQGWAYAEELGGNDAISFNLYRLATGTLLKPCEMSDSKVVEFILNFIPDRQKPRP